MDLTRVPMRRRPTSGGWAVIGLRPSVSRAPLEAGESILAARARSQRTLADIIRIFGYPEDWAAPLESQLYRRGKVWRPAQD